ncbi:hypothetical protein ASG54_13085 [Aureimonas sp. Leaf460]|nr:hypothetical protein ASG62_09215 [Aureimonas sp. Leaf427]KQT77168.1 hypothetical protein ASG54_13085 [Aureimonas sp. Leaf460]
MAMAVISDAKASFRVIAVCKRFVDWDTGELYPTSVTLSRIAGRCSRKTIERDIGNMVNLGLFIVRHDWRVTNGKLQSRRFLRLAVPDVVQWDHGCPTEPRRRWDHACPEPCPTRGPTTLEATLEEEERVDVA